MRVVIDTNVLVSGVMEVATAGRAEDLITGNTRHFKPQRGQHGVKICTPAEFVRSLPPDIIT